MLLKVCLWALYSYNKNLDFYRLNSCNNIIYFDYTIKNIFGRYSVIRMAIPADGIEIGEELKQNSALSLVPVIRMK